MGLSQDNTAREQQKNEGFHPSVLDPAPIGSVLDEAHAHLRRLFPSFENVKILERWAGLIDVTPDAIPVISKVDAVLGLHIATGFSGHGFGIGPAAGRSGSDP